MCVCFQLRRVRHDVNYVPYAQMPPVCFTFRESLASLSIAMAVCDKVLWLRTCRTPLLARFRCTHKRNSLIARHASHNCITCIVLLILKCIDNTVIRATKDEDGIEELAFADRTRHSYMRDLRSLRCTCCVIGLYRDVWIA